MEIKVTVDLGEKTAALLETFITALSGNKSVSTEAPASKTTIKTPATQEVKTEIKPTAPVVETQSTEAAVVPTTAPTYTLIELGNAAKAILDAGNVEKLKALLADQFGVKALTELAPERYGEFATAIRAMGAKI
ncbi:hypothetical protein [Fusobacterium varium]|uniref:Uncharacterized protein n=1 Tax=Fusobacterium varium ATCC 27725 TaxID=469618 RepID=A0ABM6U275_FUSVA|nr:hypothetical protein [Fusobacterium varium]AVQ30355.1 hypothetical protein C4N18_03580 [Fusobacterium varium ATCC 27725]EES64608.1 hypothetical protein FVAG_01291 [Fusobacterium varium ATCC 27725]VEH37680.1 Uncharacterised protein [Fusobacterium varium]